MHLETATVALRALRGATFIGLDTVTTVPMKGGAKNPYKDKLQKFMLGANVMCFSNTEKNAYEAMVKRRLEAEGMDPGNFQLSPRKWGTRIPDTAFVVHNDQYYLEVIFKSAGDVMYRLDGRHLDQIVVPPENAWAWAHVQSALEPKEPAPEAQGGVENKVYLRTFKLDSILALRANGREWRD